MLVLFAGAAFFFWLFSFSSLPLSSPELRKLSNGEDLLDIRFHYSAEEAFQALDRYGTAGRALYLRFLAADCIFAPIYGFAFALLMTRLSRGILSPSSRLNRINLLPLLIVTSDLAENTFIFLLIQTYPKQNYLVGSLAGIATLTKWSLTVVTLGILAALCMYSAIQRLRAGSGDTA
jgi:hypothetical protein